MVEREAVGYPSGMTEGPHVLLVDDDVAFCAAMGKALRRRGFTVQILHGGLPAVAALNGQGGVVPEVAVLDLRMPDLDGLDVLRRTRCRTTPVVVLTGHGSVPEAVEAMRLGAYTFLTKPTDASDLGPILAQAVAPVSDTEINLIGDSPETQKLRTLLDRLADADEAVLLTGEAGTGKEVAARYLHARATHAAEPFVVANMGCLSPALVESELFGQTRGTACPKQGLFAEVRGGTLFFDEVGELSMEHQAKLLRVLETREFRPIGETHSLPFRGRIVAASHQSLTEMVRAGEFREDLYYRLRVIPVELSPLRYRRADVVPIVKHWLQRIHVELTLTKAAIELLEGHDWPGNVREVVNLTRRIALFATEGRVDAALVRRMLAANPFGTVPRESELTSSPEEISLEALERRHIERLLNHHKNITHVARILQINRRTLQRKLKGWGIDHGDYGAP